MRYLSLVAAILCLSCAEEELNVKPKSCAHARAMTGQLWATKAAVAKKDGMGQVDNPKSTYLIDSQKLEDYFACAAWAKRAAVAVEAEESTPALRKLTTQAIRSCKLVYDVTWESDVSILAYTMCRTRR